MKKLSVTQELNNVLAELGAPGEVRFMGSVSRSFIWEYGTEIYSHLGSNKVDALRQLYDEYERYLYTQRRRRPLTPKEQTWYDDYHAKRDAEEEERRLRREARDPAFLNERINQLEAQVGQLTRENTSLSENLNQCIDRLAALGDDEWIARGSEDNDPILVGREPSGCGEIAVDLDTAEDPARDGFRAYIARHPEPLNQKN